VSGEGEERKRRTCQFPLPWYAGYSLPMVASNVVVVVMGVIARVVQPFPPPWTSYPSLLGWHHSLWICLGPIIAVGVICIVVRISPHHLHGGGAQSLVNISPHPSMEGRGTMQCERVQMGRSRCGGVEVVVVG